MFLAGIASMSGSWLVCMSPVDRSVRVLLWLIEMLFLHTRG